MTRLVDVMQDMGLKGEISHSGRWIRLRGEQGSVYVVEAAWSGDYYTFSDRPAEQMGKEAEDTPEIYLDPATAIEAGLQHVAGDPMTARESCGRDRAAHN